MSGIDILLLAGLALLILYPRFKKKPEDEVEDPNAEPPVQVCPPHKWEYVKMEGIEKLKCSICKRRPGEAAGGGL